MLMLVQNLIDLFALPAYDKATGTQSRLRWCSRNFGDKCIPKLLDVAADIVEIVIKDLFFGNVIFKNFHADTVAIVIE